MFREHGRDLPFTIQNYPCRDSLGRETVSWVRTFAARKQRRFDAYMICSEERGCSLIAWEQTDEAPTTLRDGDHGS